MSDINALLQSLPIDQIAQQLGEDPAAVQQAAEQALPQLLGGLEQNAQDPDGAASLANALSDHDPSLLDGGVNLSDVDPNQGTKIAQHILGPEALSIGGNSNSLINKLIPILAPIVMAWLMQQVQGRVGGQSGQTGQGGIGQTGQGGIGGVLGDILGRVLGGQSTSPTTTTPSGTAGGSGLQQILLDVLGQALGKGA